MTRNSQNGLHNPIPRNQLAQYQTINPNYFGISKGIKCYKCISISIFKVRSVSDGSVGIRQLLIRAFKEELK